MSFELMVRHLEAAAIAVSASYDYPWTIPDKAEATMVDLSFSKTTISADEARALRAKHIEAAAMEFGRTVTMLATEVALRTGPPKRKRLSLRLVHAAQDALMRIETKLREADAATDRASQRSLESRELLPRPAMADLGKISG